MKETSGYLPTSLFWRAWLPTDEPVAGVVVLVHGLHEHSGRYRHVAQQLTSAGYAVYTNDHPGHGRSPGRRGNITSMGALLDGVDGTVDLARRTHRAAPVFMYGHSLGALATLAYLTGEHRPSIDAVVLTGAALETRGVGTVQRKGAALLSKVVPNAGVADIDPAALSHDPAVVSDYTSDPLNRHQKVTARTASELLHTSLTVRDKMSTLSLPLYLAWGRDDTLMPTDGSASIIASAVNADVTAKIWAGVRHEPHNDLRRDDVLADILTWLDGRLRAAS